jgi:zinc transporter ZupT
MILRYEFPAIGRGRNGPNARVQSDLGLLMSTWLQAGLWGLLSGGALVLGAAVGYAVPLPKRVVAGVMAFGAGAVIYSVANWLVARLGAKHRKRSGAQQPSEDEAAGSGAGIALGALIDGIPESMAIGLTMLSGGAVSQQPLIREAPNRDKPIMARPRCPGVSGSKDRLPRSIEMRKERTDDTDRQRDRR